MIRRIFSLLCWIGLSLSAVLSQQSMLINHNYRPGQSEEEGVYFLYYEFQNSTLDLRHFKANYPSPVTDVPDELAIIMPNMTGLSDTVLAMAYLPAVRNKPGALVVMLISGFNTDRPIHFIDTNMDRDFRNDEPPYVFPANVKAREVKFKRGNNKYSFRLLNPFEARIEEEKAKEDATAVAQELIEVQKRDERITRELKERGNLSVDLVTHLGFGSIRYGYNLAETQYPVTYEVDMNAKGIGAGLTYRLGRLQISGNASIENIYYWSSLRTERFTDPYTVVTVDRWGREREQYFSGVTKEINQEINPNTRLSYGLDVSYAFPLSEVTEIGPYVSLIAFQYTSDEFTPDRRAENETFSFGTQLAYEGGLRFSFVVAPRGAILVSSGFRQLQYKPEGFFESREITNLTHNYYQIGLRLGYQIFL